MTFRAQRSREGWYGLLVCLALLAADALLIANVARRPISGLSFVLVLLVLLSLPIVIFVAYRSWGCLSLEYRVDRDGVTVVWGALRQAVPIGQIQRIVRGSSCGRVRPWPWPGPYAATRIAAPGKPLLCYSTRSPAEQLLLVTADVDYGISPSDTDGFVAALQQRHLLGAARMLPTQPRFAALWQWRFWRDHVAQGLLVAGLALCLALFGFLAFRFPGLPEQVALHFNSLDRPDRLGPRQGLFLLPLIGLLSYAVNAIWGGAVYRRQRLAALTLWAGAVVVQIIAGLALWSLIR